MTMTGTTTMTDGPTRHGEPDDAQPIDHPTDGDSRRSIDSPDSVDSP
jgi:hypothetical protein